MPYRLNELTAKLKEKGLDLAEEAAKAAAEGVLDWLSESAAASETPLDDIIVPVVGAVKPLALAQLDKIDGEVG